MYLKEYVRNMYYYNIVIHVHAAGFEGAIVTTVLVPEVEDALGFDFKLCW